MSRNFSGADEPYAQLRHAFVYKHKPTRTPPHLTRHRTGSKDGNPRLGSCHHGVAGPSPLVQQGERR